MKILKNYLMNTEWLPANINIFFMRIILFHHCYHQYPIRQDMNLVHIMIFFNVFFPFVQCALNNVDVWLNF